MRIAFPWLFCHDHVLNTWQLANRTYLGYPMFIDPSVGSCKALELGNVYIAFDLHGRPWYASIAPKGSRELGNG